MSYVSNISSTGIRYPFLKWKMVTDSLLTCNAALFSFMRVSHLPRWSFTTRKNGIVKSIEANNIPNYLEDTHFDLVKLVCRLLTLQLREGGREKESLPSHTEMCFNNTFSQLKFPRSLNLPIFLLYRTQKKMHVISSFLGVMKGFVISFHFFLFLY